MFFSENNDQWCALTVILWRTLLDIRWSNGLLSGFILRGRWMLESDWLMNFLRCAIIFRETHGERSSMQVFTALHVCIISPNELFQRSLRPTTAKEPKPITTLAKQINIVNKRIKTTDHVHVFATKLRFMYGKHSISPALSPTQTHTHRPTVNVCTHVNIRANVVSTTLTILSVTV